MLQQRYSKEDLPVLCLHLHPRVCTLPCTCVSVCCVCAAGGVTLHIRKLAGHNSHHIVEATFKSFARALRQATEVDPRRQGMIASSKGVLTQQ